MSDNSSTNQNNSYQVPQEEEKGMSIASMVLGIVGFIAWCLPIAGYPVTIVGIVLGVKGMKKGGKGMAIAGIIMCTITLVPDPDQLYSGCIFICCRLSVENTLHVKCFERTVQPVMGNGRIGDGSVFRQTWRNVKCGGNVTILSHSFLKA